MLPATTIDLFEVTRGSVSVRSLQWPAALLHLRRFMSSQANQPNGNERFQELLERVAEGDDSATETLIAEYGDHIMRTVRRRMHRGVRDRFDSEDFTQAVWASFFGNLSAVRRMNSELELAGFLGRMAANKVIDAGRRHQVRRERNTASDALPYVTTDNRRRVTQPTPSQFAVANERWDQISGDEDNQHRRLLAMLRSGSSRIEIAEALGVSERHVRRMLARISEKSPSQDDST